MAAEIKSFRISDETKERLEQLSEEIGGNKDRVFNTLMDSFRLQQEKRAIPDQEQAIVQFEQYANALVRLYIESLHTISSAEERVRGDFQAQLKLNAESLLDFKKQLEKAEKEAAWERDRSVHYKQMHEEEAKAYAAEKKEAKERQDAMTERIAFLEEKNALLSEKLSRMEEVTEENRKCREEMKRLSEEREEAVRTQKTIDREYRASVAKYETALEERNKANFAQLKQLQREKEEEVSALRQKLMEAEKASLAIREAAMIEREKMQMEWMERYRGLQEEIRRSAGKKE